MTSPTPQVTDFTRDVLGRYVCNGLDEALASAGTRPFDVVVIGGGAFGSGFAQHLFSRDTAEAHRVLVLEAGPLLVPEHVQNLPLIGLEPPPATSIAELRREGRDGEPRNEVWGLAWHGNVDFPGLAYCLGGRSLYWGGWVPEPLDGELRDWPAAVLDDLRQTYFGSALEQTGGNRTNDFISGELHRAMRQRVYDGLAQIADAVPAAELPLRVVDAPPGDEEVAKLEAPLAVQSNAPRPGFFAFNKFSELPLLVRAARAAWSESGGDDSRRRLMVVPQCHAIRLELEGDRVAAVQTNHGVVELPQNGVVVLAAATVENTRLALEAFPNDGGLIGRNLTVHLRSNMSIRMPRAAFPSLAGHDLQTTAVFVKCRHQRGDGSAAWFQLQLTGAGGGPYETNAEAQLFREIPDIDLLDTFASADEETIVATIRGEGEMEPNDGSFVRLDAERDEFGSRRAFVSLVPGPLDGEVWQAMRDASEQLAAVAAAGSPYETIGPWEGDGLGTTHHEAGTLWMGDDPATSVTDTDARFHAVRNAYVVGLAAFPRLGAINPMLPGLALSRRLADYLVA